MSEMTPEQLAQSVRKLAIASHGVGYFTPALVESATGLQVRFSDTHPDVFGQEGEVVGGGRYGAVSVPSGGPAKRFDFEYEPEVIAEGQACLHPISLYYQPFIDAGFEARWLGPARLGSRGIWSFTRDEVRVLAFVGKNAIEDDVNACVSRLDISL